MPRPRTNAYAHIKRTAPNHIHRRQVTEYIATYKAGKRGKGKATLVVRTLIKPPPPLREFQLAGATTKTFKRTDLKTIKRKVIVIMATKDKKSEKASKKSRKSSVDEDESTAGVDEELENLEELSEDEAVASDDDDETTSSDDDSDDEDVEKPKSKKDKKKDKKGKKQSRAKANGKIGTQEIAAEAGCDARTLRMVLRKHKIEKDEDSNRYEWESLEDPTVKKILKLIKEGAAKDVKAEGLNKLKEKKAAEKAEGKDKKGKKDKKKKNKKSKDEDED